MDPETDRTPLRRLRARGDVRAISDYQRFTGVRSTNPPPDGPDAVVVPLVHYRWLILAVCVASVAIVLAANITSGSPPIEVVGFVLVVGLSVPALMLRSVATPRAAPSVFAFEASKIWWRRYGREWEGPADLGRVQAVAAMDTSVRPGSMFVVFVGDDFPRRRQLGVPRRLRRWVGDRGYLALFVVNGRPTQPPNGIVPYMLRYTPADVEMMPGTVDRLRAWELLPTP